LTRQPFSRQLLKKKKLESKWLLKDNTIFKQSACKDAKKHFKHISIKHFVKSQKKQKIKMKIKKYQYF